MTDHPPQKGHGSKSGRVKPTGGPLLDLMERLLAVSLAAVLESGKAAPLKAVTLKGDGLTLHVALPGWLPTQRDAYPLRLRIEATGAEETVFRVQLPDSPGLGKVLDWGMKKLPDNLLNELLGGLFEKPESKKHESQKPRVQDALSKRGESWVLDHAILLRSMG